MTVYKRSELDISKEIIVQKIRQRISQNKINKLRGEFEMVEHVASELKFIKTLNRLGLCEVQILSIDYDPLSIK